MTVHEWYKTYDDDDDESQSKMNYYCEAIPISEYFTLDHGYLMAYLKDTDTFWQSVSISSNIYNEGSILQDLLTYHHFSKDYSDFNA